MIAVFQVGKSEVHTIEVYSSLFFAREIIKVDGIEVINKQKFPFWLTDYMQFEVGEEEKNLVELKYNTMIFRSRAYVNGKLHVGCLFPQVAGYNAYIIATIALIVALLAGGLAFCSFSNTSWKKQTHLYSIDKDPPHELKPLTSPEPSDIDSH